MRTRWRKLGQLAVPALLAAACGAAIDGRTAVSASTDRPLEEEMYMASATQANDVAEIKRTLGAYHAAMVDARVDLLEKLVAADFALVHITGYVQPRNEWFGVIRSRAFDYHAIDVDKDALTITPNGDQAVVVGRGIFNATINGMKSPWRLAFTMQFAKQDGTWIIAHARYSSF